MSYTVETTRVTYHEGTYLVPSNSRDDGSSPNCVGAVIAMSIVNIAAIAFGAMGFLLAAKCDRDHDFQRSWSAKIMIILMALYQ